MDEEPQKPKPKIDLTIGLLVGIVMVIADLIDLIPLAGDIVDLCIGAPLQLWLFFEGIRGTFVLVGNIVEAIPVLQEFPLTRTITWGVTWFIDANPKLEKITELTGGLEGGGELGEAGAAMSEATSTAQTVAETAQTAERAAEVGEVATETAKTAEAVTEVGGQVSQAGAEIGEVGGDIGVGAPSGTGGTGAGESAKPPTESSWDKVKAELKERVQEQIEQGFGGDPSYEPTDDDVAAEIEKQEKEKELNRALGEPEPVMEGLERGLFAQASPFNQAGQQQEEPTSRPAGQSSGLHVVGGRNASKQKPTTQDILAKSQDKQAQFHKNRQGSDDVDELAA